MSDPPKRGRNVSLDKSNPSPAPKRPSKFDMAQQENASPFMPIFENFRAELDEHHDRRERIIKASRDITANSKKAVPVSSLLKPLPPQTQKAVEPLFTTIDTLFKSIAPDLTGINAWRYQRQISPGIQEYIEAVAFRHYLITQQLLSCREAQTLFPAGIELTEDDWALGIFDLIGEIMRWTITGIATGGEVPGNGDGQKRNVVTDLRELRVHLQAINAKGSSLGKDLYKKQEVMRTCVEKVETAAYGLAVRGNERPKGWVPDDRDEGRIEVESY